MRSAITMLLILLTTTQPCLGNSPTWYERNIKYQFDVKEGDEETDRLHEIYAAALQSKVDSAAAECGKGCAKDWRNVVITIHMNKIGRHAILSWVDYLWTSAGRPKYSIASYPVIIDMGNDDAAIADLVIFSLKGVRRVRNK